MSGCIPGEFPGTAVPARRAIRLRAAADSAVAPTEAEVASAAVVVAVPMVAVVVVAVRPAAEDRQEEAEEEALTNSSPLHRPSCPSAITRPPLCRKNWASARICG